MLALMRDIKGNALVQLASLHAHPLHAGSGELANFVPEAATTVLVHREDVQSVCVRVDECEDGNTRMKYVRQYTNYVLVSARDAAKRTPADSRIGS